MSISPDYDPRDDEQYSSAEIICPWCGHGHDPCDLECYEDRDNQQCQSCYRHFNIGAIHTIGYTTTKEQR